MGVEDFNVAFDGILQFQTRFGQVVHLLEIEPEFGAVAKETGQAQSGIGRDGAFAVDNFADAGGRDANLERQGVLRDAERDEKLLSQHRAGMRGDALKIPSGGRSLNGHDYRSFGVRSMVVRNLHLVSPVSLPDKANTVLIVDKDAVLADAVSLQSLKPVAGREAQVTQIGGGLDLVQLAAGNLTNRCPAFTKPVSKSFLVSSSLKLRIIFFTV
jgi:hypothetical protein